MEPTHPFGDIRKALGIALSPGENTEAEIGVKEGLLLYYRIASIPAAVTFLLAEVPYVMIALLAVFPSSTSSASAAVLTILAVASMQVLRLVLFEILLLFPALMLFLAGLLHLMGRLLGTFKKGFARTFAATVYGSMPLLLTMWLMFLVFMYVVLTIPNSVTTATLASYPAYAVNAIYEVAMLAWGVVIGAFTLENQQGTTKLAAFLTMVATGIMLFIFLIIAVIFA